MSTILDLDARVQQRTPVTEDELKYWISQSDVSRAGTFYGHDQAAALAATRRVCDNFISLSLNNPHLHEVPLRRKTKFCLILNNFALHPPMRQVVFEALENLTSIFESAIKDEGALPFDSELGRMSEHVLVLLMRVTNYKLPASAVLEFAEGNTQFAVQLLLAILLKEPPYEFELRYNCITGLFGFTQPQAFFRAGDAVGEYACTQFTEKVDFMLQLMLRLQAVQVVSDVLSAALSLSNPPPAMAQAGVSYMMRTIINIFRFASKKSTQWRQHVLLSTTFLDGTVTLLAQSLVSTLEAGLAQPRPHVSQDTVRLLHLCFKFGTFASYHLAEAAYGMRIYCTFFHDLLQISIRPLVMDAAMSGQLMLMYAQLFHYMINTDALRGDQEIAAEHLLPELTSHELGQSLHAFLEREVAGCGLAFAQAWFAQLQRIDIEAPLAKESVTYQTIHTCYTTILQQLGANQQPAAAAPKAAATRGGGGAGGRLLGEMPALKPNATHKMSIDKAAAPVKVAQTKVAQPARQDNVSGVDPSLLCALTGNLMKHPVSSPYGHTFEKEAITNWLEQNGSVCPITGKPLSVVELTPNKAIATKLMQHMIQQTMMSQTQGGEDDLYAF